MPAQLDVRHLTKLYGQTTAIIDFSLQVEQGEIFGLLGPNGAGKTTAIECMLGLRRPDSGTISIAGLDALENPNSIKAIIGAQLQATALQDKITPREAFDFFGSFYRNAIKPSDLLNRFSLLEKADAPFDTLSTGQKQRLAIALAFVNNPRVLFLDEPTAGLDPHSRRELHRDIQQLKSDGRTIFLSTHYIEEAEQLCDRIAILSAGRIIATGTPTELITNAKLTQYVLLKTAPALSESALRTLLVARDIQPRDNGWRITAPDISNCVIALVKLMETEKVQLIDLQIHRATLQDAYLAITPENSHEEIRPSNF